MKNIVLIGLMGAGKSSVGKKLSQLSDYDFVDTDDLIEKKLGLTISEIFAQRGESFFRELEASVILDLSSQEKLIISTGGGSLQNPLNLENLKQNGFLVYLKTTPESLYGRIKNEKHRPLLCNDNPLATLKELLIKREEQYLQADFTIDTTDKDIDEITNEILKVYNENI